MSVESVKNYLKKFGADSRVVELNTSTATVELAANALGCKPCEIAKSLTFNVGGEAVMIVAAGDVRIDNRRFKDTFGVKAKMLTHEEVEDMIGHKVGGVCPFGVKDGVKVYLDESLRQFEYVYPAAGAENALLKLSLEELERFSGALGFVDVGKLPE